MTNGYKIFDRMYEQTQHFDDLKEQKAIKDELAAYDQATRDELLSYADRLASKWKSAGKDGYAGLWEAFAEEVRRAGQG